MDNDRGRVQVENGSGGLQTESECGVVVGGELQMENYSGWLQMEKCDGLHTVVSFRRITTVEKTIVVIFVFIFVITQLQTDNESGLKR